MSGRGGFSLVEMVIVLVLAGIVSTAAVSMFSTQNELNASLTALGESQENARSAVQVAAMELRSAARKSVVSARADRLVIRIPISVGVVCGAPNASLTSVYFPLEGRTLDMRTDVDAYDVRSIYGTWSDPMRPRSSDGFNRGQSRQACIDAGAGAQGSDTDYASLRVGGASVAIGSPVRLFREITYYFAASTLDPARRAFYRARRTEAVELATGFSADTRFEFSLAGDTSWHAAVRTADLERIDAIRVVANVEGEGTSGVETSSASFSLTREIQLRNAQ